MTSAREIVGKEKEADFESLMRIRKFDEIEKEECTCERREEDKRERERERE